MARWLLLALFIALPTTAYAWGGDGHRIVCAIAWDEMKAPVRQKVQALLSIQTREQFADACNWADDYRESHRETAPWHFINVPLGAITVDVARDCKEPRSCAVVQIERDVETLRSTVPKEQKAEALKFLGHFVGDVHQPLHVGHAEDRGGNSIRAEFEGHATDLHAVWDTGLIKAAHRSWQEIARELRRKVTPEKRHVWIGSIPAVWANESLAIANAPATEYSDRHMRLLLGPDYERRSMPVVYDRLSRAGVRLAYLLNEALGNGR